MSDPNRDEIYYEPTVPDALECPHCKNILPSHSSICPECGKDFVWGSARQIYWSRELTQVSGDVVTISTASKALIEEIKDDFSDLRSTFTVKQKEIVEERDLNRKLDDLEEKMDNFGVQADKIETAVKEINVKVDNIDEKTEDKPWTEKIVENITDNIIGYIVVGVISFLLAWIGLG